MDPLKVFFGQLHPHLIKWQFIEWLQSRHSGPLDVFLRPSAGGAKPQCAFAVYANVEDAQQATMLNGVVSADVSPSFVKAHMYLHGGL